MPLFESSLNLISVQRSGDMLLLLLLLATLLTYVFSYGKAYSGQLVSTASSKMHISLIQLFLFF